jgi:prepilin-type N-terminal cleavage/methylation domain-containing protein
MRKNDIKGFTLVELLIAIAIMAVISSAAVVLVTASFEAHGHGTITSRSMQDGFLAMERMTQGVRRCTFLLVPNNHNKIRDILAFSGLFNDDNDFYFNDTLFPRIDEDMSFDMNEDTYSGIEGIDEDGDGFVDEYSVTHAGQNDDEDEDYDEDPIDGIDNDGDGNIDEDCGGDMNDDGAPGIAGIDDDNDGLVDEGSIWDDDEDDSLDEVGIIPVVYTYNSGNNTLTEWFPYTGDTTVLSTNVTAFQVEFLSPEKILITLEITGDDGEVVDFSEVVFLRNSLQKTGKRVR